MAYQYSEHEKGRLIRKVKQRIDKGMTIKDACQRVGISTASWHKWTTLPEETHDIAPPAPPVVPLGLIEEAIQKEVNAFVNELDQRIHTAMEKAVADLYQKYKPS